MAIKFITLLILVTSSFYASASLNEIKHRYNEEHQKILNEVEEEELDPEDYSLELKELYFQTYQTEANLFLKNDQFEQSTTQLQSILEAFEYKEDEVSKISEKIEAHQKELQQKKFQKNYSLEINYLSWQREIDIKSPTIKNKIIVTNQATCLGGGLHFSNAYYVYGVEGCLLTGTGDTKEKKSPPKYKESDIPLWGIKTSLNAGMIVSTAGAQLGVKLPLLYSIQNLKNPPDNTFKLKEDHKILFFPTLYTRLPLGTFFIQSEIGPFLDQSNTLYSIGAGFTF
ncbi:MAG: hypothetical protein NDI69_00020 [Bacteriovoracaceae bacterium]|nr:hypothetical protein [Bacteriovoracaceae bacterium]